MAKFAIGLLKKMDQVSTKLEMMFGPDTSELTIRKYNIIVISRSNWDFSTTHALCMKYVRRFCELGVFWNIFF